MLCPYCRSDNDRVIDSRACQDGAAIRRRRECTRCKRRYTTYERIEEPVIKVVKKDGARVAYDRSKIRAGLEKACWKRCGNDQIDELMNEIESRIFDRLDQTIDSREIGEMVMELLKSRDEVAYLRFASVYKSFQNGRDFVDGLGPGG